MASKLAQFLTNLSPYHLSVANRVISYLYLSQMLSLCYSHESGQVFSIFGDAVYTDDPLTHHSSFGFIFMLFGSPINWKARKQQTVTISSTEAEILATSATVKETVWWQQFFTNINLDLNHNVVVKLLLDMLNMFSKNY